MSTGFECQFIEAQRGKWFCILQNWDCPVGAWDWREYANAYGPYPSENAAVEALFENEANPGGWSITNFELYLSNDPDEVESKLIAKARPW